MLALSSIMNAASLAGGGPVTLSNTATPLATGNGNPSNKVHVVEFRAVPGYACKAYIGTAGMDRTTLANVLAVIYPNSTGGWSDRYRIEDPRLGDGVDLSTLRVAGDCPGEQITVAWFQTGTVLATLTPVQKGLRTPSGIIQVADAGTPTANLIQFRVVPGYVGKVNAHAYLYGQPKIAVLYPNTGNPAQSSANNEAFEISDRSHSLLPYHFGISTDLAGEGLLVNVWRDSSAP